MGNEQKEFLEEQLDWTKGQIDILDQMDMKLREMKKIAEYAAENNLSMGEREKLSSHLEEIKNEYRFLEAKRTPLLV